MTGTYSDDSDVGHGCYCRRCEILSVQSDALGMRPDALSEVCIDMGTGMRIGMCMDMCMDLCTDMCIDMCIDMRFACGPTH